MGKYSDALEKSRKKHKTAVATNESPKTDENGQSEKDVISFDGSEVLYGANNFDKNLVAFLKPQSFEAEQFRLLKTKLFFSDSIKAPRSIIVTSSVPSEGKSFVAANLAITIAHSLDEHVLIIDCDFRRPGIHKQFGFGDVPGLVEYLSNGTSLSSLFLKTKVNKLSILPGGKPPQNPTELLSSKKMAKFLQEVKERYSDRFIIIDSAPPEVAAETYALSKLVDGALLIIDTGRTPRNMISDLVETIGKDKVIGVICNRLDIRFSGYYGYGKYSKYSKYYKNYK